MQLPFSINDWPADACEAFEERAAIVEHMARRSRGEAERLAEQITRDEWSRR